MARAPCLEGRELSADRRETAWGPWAGRGQARCRSLPDAMAMRPALYGICFSRFIILHDQVVQALMWNFR